MGLKEKRAIGRLLDELATCSLIESFYPTFISKTCGYPLSDVFDILLSFVKDDCLRLKWEIRCTEYYCSRTITTISEQISDMKEYITCVCGKENEVTLENIYPVFSFVPEYKECILAEKQEVLDKPKKKDLQKTFIQSNKGCSLATVIKEKGLDSFIGQNPAAVMNFYFTDQVTIDKQGDNKMGDTYDFKGSSVDAKNSMVNFGVANRIESASIDSFQEATKKLLQELEVAKKDQHYEQIENGIQQITEHLKSDKPDFSYITFLKQGLDKAYNMITKPASLVTAYFAWEKVLTALCTLL